MAPNVSETLVSEGDRGVSGTARLVSCVKSRPRGWCIRFVGLLGINSQAWLRMQIAAKIAAMDGLPVTVP